MKLEINNLTKDRIDPIRRRASNVVNKKFLEKVAKKTSRILKIKLPEISLVIVGETRIKALNKKYRNRNKVTDVLAFDYGEIFICLPQAKRQAKKLGHSIKQELGILLIHGILHLAGYDDKKIKDREKMLHLQEKLISKIINQ